MARTLLDLAWPLRTERLLIRPARVDDADATWAYRRLPAVSQWLGSAAPDRADYTRTFTEPRRLAGTLVVESGGPGRTDVIGDLKLAVGNAWAQAEVTERAVAVQAEIGWAFDPAAHGRGYATESVTAQLDVAFRGLGLRRVAAYCFADNAPSWHLMERVGMRREGHGVADSLHRSGRWVDGLVYAMLAHEWRSRS